MMTEGELESHMLDLKGASTVLFLKHLLIHGTSRTRTMTERHLDIKSCNLNGAGTDLAVWVAI